MADIFRFIIPHGTMQHASIVPQHRVTLTPDMTINKSLILSEGEQFRDQCAAVVGRHALDIARPSANVQSRSTGVRMSADQRMKHVWPVALLLLGQSR